MTPKKLKEKIEDMFCIEIKESYDRLSIDHSHIYSVFYNIGNLRFGFTRSEMDDAVGLRGYKRANGMLQNHWLKIEVKPVYNFIYMKALLEIFKDDLADDPKVKTNEVLKRLFDSDQETIDYICKNKINPFFEINELKTA